MPKTGADLGADLSELWLCGRSYLPATAEVTAAANAIVAGTAGVAVDGSAVYPLWDTVRDELQRILAEATDNLYAVGDALVRVADTYAATDAAARAEMERLKSQYVMSDRYRIDDPTVRPQPQPPQ